MIVSPSLTPTTLPCQAYANGWLRQIIRNATAARNAAMAGYRLADNLEVIDISYGDDIKRDRQLFSHNLLELEGQKSMGISIGRLKVVGILCFCI